MKRVLALVLLLVCVLTTGCSKNEPWIQQYDIAVKISVRGKL